MKKAHMYNGLIVLTSIVIISVNLVGIIYGILITIAYAIITFLLTTSRTKGHRTPQRFGKYYLFYLSKIGLPIYFMLVIIGIILEFLN